MSYEAYRPTLRLCAASCMISVFTVMVSGTVAAQSLDHKNRVAVAAADAAVSAPIGGGLTPSTVSSPQDQQPAQTNSSPSSASKSATTSTSSATPLTPRQKFKYFARSSFMPPMPYALSVLSGVFSEATDKDHGRHMTAGDFMADSMTHAARAFAFRSTANFFEKFAFASAFKQDPRYFKSDKKGFARIGYAVSRVFVTQSDSGHDQFNASFLAGGLVAAGISNAWVRTEDRTASSTLSRFGIHVGYRALSNVIQELFGKH